jgi:hypothetical protein
MAGSLNLPHMRDARASKHAHWLQHLGTHVMKLFLALNLKYPWHMSVRHVARLFLPDRERARQLTDVHSHLKHSESTKRGCEVY